MTEVQELFVRNAEAVTASVDGQLVALDAESGSCFGLNEVATVIWDMLEGPASAAMLCDQLCEAYDVDRTECATQVSELLDDLISCNLIARA